jgi:hypothetical protein
MPPKLTLLISPVKNGVYDARSRHLKQDCVGGKCVEKVHVITHGCDVLPSNSTSPEKKTCKERHRAHCEPPSAVDAALLPDSLLAFGFKKEVMSGNSRRPCIPAGEIPKKQSRCSGTYMTFRFPIAEVANEVYSLFDGNPCIYANVATCEGWKAQLSIMCLYTDQCIENKSGFDGIITAKCLTHQQED